jgi:hypothetical protein
LTLLPSRATTRTSEPGRQDAGDISYRLHHQRPGFGDTVAVPDADIILASPYFKCGIDHHGFGEQVAVRDDHAPPVIGLDGRRPRLYLLDRSLEPFHHDLVPDTERLGQKYQDAGQIVLENPWNAKPMADTADSEELYDLTGLERRQNDAQRHEKPDKNDGPLREPPENKPDIARPPVLLGQPPNQGPDTSGDQNKRRRRPAGRARYWAEARSGLQKPARGLVGCRKVNIHGSVPPRRRI